MNIFSHTFPRGGLRNPPDPVHPFSDEEIRLAGDAMKYLPANYAYSIYHVAEVLRRWERLQDHLNLVGKLTAAMASEFESGSYGFAVGMVHDLGKLKDLVLRYFVLSDAGHWGGNERSPDHWTLGAVYLCHLCETSPELIRPLIASLALIVEGHHHGLVDINVVSNIFSSEEGLIYNNIPKELLPKIQLGAPPDFIMRALESFYRDKISGGQDIMFWARFLFSCLCDSDSLSTEWFCDKDRSGLRQTRPGRYLVGLEHPVLMENPGDWDEISAAVERKVVEFQGKRGGQSDEMRFLRGAVSQCALEAAVLCRGFFDLTSSTGTGKTLAALRFALAHLKKHGMKRIVVVIPYCSVIDQTCKFYREIMGDELYLRNVVEVHSNFDPHSLERASALQKEIDDLPPEKAGLRMAKKRELVEVEKRLEKMAEASKLMASSWDAPIVITTAVQLYESFYGCRRSQLRKLHNSINSVVIIDEPQSNPYWHRDAFRVVEEQLVRNYGCTVVRSTATQPEEREGSRSIVTVPNMTRAARCEIRFPDDLTKKADWDDVIERAINPPVMPHRYAQSMTVVPRRILARKLAKQVSGSFHLSSLMCQAHRINTLSRVRETMEDGRRTILFATPIIQVGYDLDFPYIQSFMASYYAMLQAAGRSGRNGLWNGLLEIYVSPVDLLGDTACECECTRNTIRESPPGFDPYDPEILRRFYKAMDAHCDGDRYKVLKKSMWDFKGVARAIRMIREQQVTVVVPYDDHIGSLERINNSIKDYKDNPDHRGRAMQELQSFCVEIYPNEYESIGGAFDEVDDCLKCLRHDVNLYDPWFGLLIPESKPRDRDM